MILKKNGTYKSETSCVWIVTDIGRRVFTGGLAGVYATTIRKRGRRDTCPFYFPLSHPAATATDIRAQLLRSYTINPYKTDDYLDRVGWMPRFIHYRNTAAVNGTKFKIFFL